MQFQEHDRREEAHVHCCPCHSPSPSGISRRGFIGSAAALGGVALTGLSWSALAAEELGNFQAPQRRPLVVKPVLCFRESTPRPQASWRPWGGIENRQDAEKEVVRIKGELDALAAAADFPVRFLPVTAVKSIGELGAAKEEIASADVTLVYAAGSYSTLSMIGETAKNTIIFCRHRSGPLYLLYETVSAVYLRKHTDHRQVKNIDEDDVVIDSQKEILWRLRALCGLQNTLGAKILAVGGPSAWGTSERKESPPVAPKLAKDRFNFDIQTISYDELGKLILEAKADKATADDARRRADEYLALPGTTLETERRFVDNAFLLERVFKQLLKKADCRAITINNCMGTVMEVAETTACLPLSTLNDAGYQAFCESDFVVVPAGLLLGNISGKPQFMNDPTYPHEGIITLAHCTGPRKMNGKRIEPARILTHFESDYGAATKVEMPKGQVLTNVIPDFEAKRYIGLRGEIIDAPFLTICRDQIDVRIECDSLELARRMPGFHWITCYGDHLREFGYALKRVGIEWEPLA